MTSEQIKSHFNSLFKELALLLGENTKGYIAGGAIASLVLDQKPKDYDIWFETLEDWLETVSLLGQKKHEVTKYAATCLLPSGKKIQLVCNRLGKPEELVKTFDYLHCQSYYLQDGTLKYDEDFIKKKELNFAGDLCHPVNSLERMIKFVRRGYFVPADTLHRVLIEVAKLGEEKVRTLPRHSGSL